MAVVILVLKATLVLTVGLAGVQLARPMRASLRHLLLTVVFGTLLVLPVGASLLPTLVVAQPAISTSWLSEAPAAVAEPTGWLSPTTGAPSGAARATDRSSLAPHRRVSLAMIAWTVWAVGVLTVLVSLVAAVRHIARLRRSGVPDLAHQVVLDRLCGSVRHAVLVIHEDIRSPVTFGTLRPMIALPRDADTWSEADLERALVHELAHVRRRDWLVQVLARIVCALYWFHPLVWIAWRCLDLESERACDDAVLAHSEGTAYAEQLIRIARRLAEQYSSPILSMANRSDLAARIEAVLNRNQSRGPVGPRTASAILATAGAIVMLLAPLTIEARTVLSALPALPTVPLVSMTMPLADAGPARLVAPSVSPRRVARPEQPIAAVAAIATPSLPLKEESQTPSATRPAFDVASIKPNNSGALQMGLNIPPGNQVTLTNAALRNLIQIAYFIRPEQLVGAPSWIDTARYDIVAKTADPTTPVYQMRLMLQTLLEDRFKLVLHKDSKPIPVYALVLAKSDGTFGPNLHQSATFCGDLGRGARGTTPPPPPQPGEPTPCEIRPGMAFGRIIARGLGMDGLAALLTQPAGRTVVDRTGLARGFDINLVWTPEQLPAARDGIAPPELNGPSFFTALQEQLGLKLKEETGSIEVLVVDHVDPPSEN